MELSNEFEVKVPIEQAWAVLTDLERIAPCLPGAQLQEIEGDEHRGVVKVKVGPITAQYKGAARFVEKDEAAHRAVLSAAGRDTRGQGNASASIVAQLTDQGASTHVSVLTDLTITGKVAQFGRGVIGDVSVKLLGQFVENLESMVLADDGPAEEPADVPADDAKDEAVPAGLTGRPNDTTELLASELAKVLKDDPAEAEATRPERATLAPRPDLLAEEQGIDPVDEPAPAPAEAPAAAPAADGGVRRIDSPEVEPIDLLDQAGSPVAKRLLPLVGVVVVVLVVLRLRRRRARRR